MYIKKLELLNFQVIEKFEAEFNGNVYFVTGDNELGKSTLLKAIGALLTGERDEVLRNGASKGFAKMVVGDDGEEFDVSLSFTENNPRGTLTIKQKSTGMASNNVTMLQRLFGYQDFDAVEFSRWSETAEGRRKQIAVVKSLLPDNIKERIEAIDKEVADLKTERTGVNRDVKTYETLMNESGAKLEAGDAEKYADPIDVTKLMEQQSLNAQLIEKAKTVRAAKTQREQELAGIDDRIKNAKSDCDSELASIEETVANAKKAYEDALRKAESDRAEAKQKLDTELEQIENDRQESQRRLDNCTNWLKEYEENNPENSDVPGLIENAESHNRKHALVVQYSEKKKQFEEIKAKADKMDVDIESLAKERAELITKSELPIAGLSFSDDGLTLNGVPFVPGKVSDSQTMEIAAKLIIASNPKIKVFRIARGESLGAKRLQTIIEIAKKNGYQGFLEQVVRGQEELRVEEYTEK